MAFTHLIMFLLPLLPLLAVAVGGGSCPAGDASSLLAFKRALSDPDGYLVSWFAAVVNCCLWSHVSCNATGVASLLLAGLSLSSSDKDALAPLAGLTNLVSLDLSNNSFADLPIPAGIFHRLPRLTHLNLSMSGFNGSVPPDVGRARMLVSLDLSQNMGGGLRVEDASFLADLPELELLYLDGVDLSMAFPPGTSCRAFSSGSPKLRVVSLEGCSLVNCPFETLLNNLTSITHLHLDWNNFSSSPIPAFLSDFPSLSVLRLASCGLVGEFPVAVFQMKRLRVLDVSNNLGLSGKLSEFPKGSILEELVLSHTNFTGELPSSIGNLAHLKNLDASNAELSGELPEEIKKMAGLTYLDLSSNKFTGRIPSLVALKRLVRLDLSSNSFQGFIYGIADNLPSLEFLNLGNNTLRGSIPTSLFSLPSLKSLALKWNNLSGELREFDVNGNTSVLSTIDLSRNHIQGQFPRSVYQLPRLETLQISYNNFSGVLQLDMSIGSMSYLQNLDLSHCGLSVQVHDKGGLSNFPQLQSLKLASCNLTGIPEWLQNQTGLSELDLSGNRISGDIPNWMWKFEFPWSFNLSSNYLTGLQQYDPSSTFPPILDHHSSQLQGTSVPLPYQTFILDMSNNRLHSTLSQDIGTYLSRSIFVSLSGNKLFGSIPSSICETQDLLVLDMSENNFNGSIPPCFAKKMSSSLRIVNLHTNSISGAIPDAFPIDCRLRTLDLSGNKIAGQIPTSLKNCKGLQVLILSNNSIEGAFPSWLGAMPHLRVLVLHSNRLQGRLEPASLVGFGKLQIIDLSSNNFSGNLCSSCFNTWKSMVASDIKPSAYEVLQRSFMYVIYVESVTLTLKGSKLKMEKIPNKLFYIDLSNNRLEGFIPETIGNLRLLRLLNFSHNALTDTIPRSIGNLLQLESLDLSRNNLTGEIPQEIVHLTFLAVLNLSSNRLVGEIPRGQQLITFSASSYLDNAGLCGFPLSNSCEHYPSEYTSSSKSRSLNMWTWIVAQIGFIFGFGVIWLPLAFFRRWWILYFSYVDSLLWRIPFLHRFLQY